MAAATPFAVAAGGEAQQHGLAWLEVALLSADVLDDAGALVAEDARKREGNPARADTEVGGAQTDGGHTHEDLSGAGIIERDLPRNEGRTGSLDDGCGCSSHLWFLL